MKNIFPIMKLTERKTLVERRRDDGSFYEYIICDCIRPVVNGEPNEYEWDSGMYSFTLEGIIKTAALYCYEPIYRYVVTEVDSYHDSVEHVYNTYDEAHRAMEDRFNRLRDDEDCTYSEYEASSYNDVALLYFKEDDCRDESWVQLKLIEVKVK